MMMSKKTLAIKKCEKVCMNLNVPPKLLGELTTHTALF